jgi:hypothetical protein
MVGVVDTCTYISSCSWYDSNYIAYTWYCLRIVNDPYHPVTPTMTLGMKLAWAISAME